MKNFGIILLVVVGLLVFAVMLNALGAGTTLACFGLLGAGFVAFRVLASPKRNARPALPSPGAPARASHDAYVKRVEKLDELRQMEPVAFEQFVASLFERMGYTVETTPLTGDEGIDLMLRKGEKTAIVQCKRYEGSVGAPIVRELYGAMVHVKANEAYIITTGTITLPAQRWAKDKPIHLVDGTVLIEWVETFKEEMAVVEAAPVAPMIVPPPARGVLGGLQKAWQQADRSGKMVFAGVGGVGVFGAVCMGCMVLALLTPSTPRSAPGAQPLIAPKAASSLTPARPSGESVTASPSHTATPSNTPAPRPTATEPPSVETFLAQVEAAWDKDWEKVIELLEAARRVEPSNPTVVDKLYAARFNYGQYWLKQGRRDYASANFTKALEVNPNGDEAKAALIGLTPSPTPRPATATVIPTATVRPIVATVVPTSSGFVTFVTVDGGPPGGEASVTVKTTPRAQCSIFYSTPAGTGSEAQGLVPRQADENGEVSWSWNIGSRTRRGVGSVTVTCNGARGTAPITIG